MKTKLLLTFAVSLALLMAQGRVEPIEVRELARVMADGKLVIHPDTDMVQLAQVLVDKILALQKQNTKLFQKVAELLDKEIERLEAEAERTEEKLKKTTTQSLYWAPNRTLDTSNCRMVNSSSGGYMLCDP